MRVYYEDTDQAGVVYYANYLKFLERARTEWLRSLGFEQPALAREHNVIFVVRTLHIEYRRPALFNDELVVEVELTQARGGLMVLSQTVRRGDESLAAAEVHIACVNTRSFKPVRIPGPVLEAIAARMA